MKRRRKSCFVLYTLVISTALIATAMGNQVATVFSESLPIPIRRCIIIDAGHGGEDGGATSCTGILESSINLEIALRLQDIFHLLGYKTKMIRTTDTSIYTQGSTIAQKKISDLKERVNIVNKTENALLISIHQNNFPDGRYSGAQVFYGVAEESQSLAKMLQLALVETLNPGSSRKIKKANGVYLMDHIEKTGILVECGFLSNPEEEARLRDAGYQKNMCCVIAATVGQFLSNPTAGI